MATTTGQRMGIWVIASIMLIGTLGGFIAMMVTPGNAVKDQEALAKEQEQWNQSIEAWQAKVDERNAKLSEKHLPVFSQFTSRPSVFEKDSVPELRKEDLLTGEGQEITEESKFAVYYILWGPDGKVIEQSIKDGALGSPLEVEKLSAAQLIDGWKQGLIGMKIGGVRKLAIPSELAYGETGSGESIPANTPLKFVVMAIDWPEQIAIPEMPPLVKKEYQRNGY